MLFLLFQPGALDPVMPLQVAVFDWRMIVAALINAVIVLTIAVPGLKHLMPIIKQKYPYMIPIIAAVAGLVMGATQDALYAWLGYPIDLGPIVAVLTGTFAVAMHQVGKQVKKRG